jgi:stage V sporulation protein B
LDDWGLVYLGQNVLIGDSPRLGQNSPLGTVPNRYILILFGTDVVAVLDANIKADVAIDHYRGGSCAENGVMGGRPLEDKKQTKKQTQMRRKTRGLVRGLTRGPAQGAARATTTQAATQATTTQAATRATAQVPAFAPTPTHAPTQGMGQFLKGTLFLTAAGLISKVLGSVYRIPLTRMIGPEGMGLFQMAYPIYLIFLALSTAGFPVAVSKLIAERTAIGDSVGVRTVRRASLLILTILGAFSGLALFFGARPLARIFYDPRAFYTIAAFAPAVFFMSAMSAWRGYFQGMQHMAPVAVSQVIEQIVRVATMLALAAFLIRDGVEHAAAAVAYGGATGAAAGAVYLWIVYLSFGRRFEHAIGNLQRKADFGAIGAFGAVIRKIVSLAWPVALGAVLVPLTQAVDSLIVPARLASLGLGPEAASAAMGHLGNAWALVMFPTVLTGAVSTNMVPAVSAALARDDWDRIRARVSDAFRIVFLVGVPAWVGLASLSKEISAFLFSNAGAGAAAPLVWLAPASLFFGLQQATTGALQGLGKPHLPVQHFLIGAVGKIIVTVWLTGMPGFGLCGAALGTVVCSVLAALLNCAALIRITGRVASASLTRTIWSSVVGGLAVALIIAWSRRVIGQIALPQSIMVLLIIGVSAIIYGLIMLKTGAISRDEIKLISAGGRSA